MQTVNASLIYRDGDELRHVVLLPGDKVKFGRDNTNDIRLALFPIQDIVFQLATTDISRQHFVVYRKENGYTIRDLGSTNGTSVNCIAVIASEMPLENDQIIDIGGVLDIKVAIKDRAMWLYRLTNTHQESYLLFPDSLTMGTSQDNTLVLKDPSIAEHHVRIICHDANYAITKVEDAAVQVNGIPLTGKEERRLEHEAHIALGEVDILFKLHR